MTEIKALDTVRAELAELARYAFDRLRGRLAGLTDDEYFWEPAPLCWSVRPGPDGVYRQDGDESEPDPVPAPLTTIAWRICHIIDVISAEHNATWLGLRPATLARGAGEPATAAAAIDLLDGAYRVFAECLSTVDSETLPGEIGPAGGRYSSYSRLSFVLHQLDELIHHAAEVAALRDLYRVMNQAP